MKKYILAAAFSLVLLSSPLATHAASLTSAQINAIIGLLQSFAVDQATIDSVRAALGGSTTGGFCYHFDTNLMVGSSGADVTALNQALTASGIDTTGVTSIYTEITASAVSDFQEKYKSEILTPNGLSHGTGYVGPATRAKLNALYVCGATPSVTVLSPNGGETWEIGSNQTITWNSQNLGTSVVRIFLEKSDVSTELFTSTTNDGHEDWTVPSLGLSNDYKIYIKRVDDLPATADTSDAPFSIVAATTDNPSCTLSASPASIAFGGSSSLSWTTTNATTFSIDNSIGSVTPVASGSKTVSPTATTLYTGTVTGTGGTTATCTKEINVTTTTSPDLIAGAVSPTTATAGTAATFTSTITNQGGGSTGAGFTSLFQRATDATGAGAADMGSPVQSAALAAGATAAAPLSYTFASAGTYYVRVCADRGVANAVGVITESNETNNCSAWTAMMVTTTTTGNHPVATVSPTSFAPGASFTTLVTGAAPNATIHLYYRGPDGVAHEDSTTGTTDTAGQFTRSLSTTGWASGVYTRWVVVNIAMSPDPRPTFTITGGTQSCSFNGQTYASGQSVTAYQAASVAAGQTCQSEQRTCTNGTLSGTYTAGSCTVTPALQTCPFNGQTYASGQSVTAYQAASVAAGQTCQSEQRTCTNGTLSGTYTAGACTVTSVVYNPVVTVSPTSFVAGAAFTVWVTGAAPNSSVRTICRDPNNVVCDDPATYTTDVLGTWSHTYYDTTGWTVGNYSGTATVNDVRLTPDKTFRVNAPPITYTASANFSSTQGQNNWYYLTSTGAQMTFDSTNNRWKGSQTYPALLWGDGGHPGSNTDAVRRWIASSAGSVRITGNVRDGDAGGGDGVIVYIRKSGINIWQQTIANGNTTGFNYDLTVSVYAGETIDFVINKIGNDQYDSTVFDPTIVLTNAIAASAYTNPGLASALSAFNGATGATNTVPQGTNNFTYLWNRDLQIGSPYADDVSALQTALTLNGEYAGDITGGFYTQTYLAVKAFQQKYDIEATGFVGSLTRAKLNAMFSR